MCFNSSRHFSLFSFCVFLCSSTPSLEHEPFVVSFHSAFSPSRGRWKKEEKSGSVAEEERGRTTTTIRKTMEALARALRSFHERHEKIKHTVHTVSQSPPKQQHSFIRRLLLVGIPFCRREGDGNVVIPNGNQYLAARLPRRCSLRIFLLDFAPPHSSFVSLSPRSFVCVGRW